MIELKNANKIPLQMQMRFDLFICIAALLAIQDQQAELLAHSSGRVLFTYTACTHSNNRNAHSECLHQQREKLQVQMAPSLHAGSSVCAAIWVRALV